MTGFVENRQSTSEVSLGRFSQGRLGRAGVRIVSGMDEAVLVVCASGFAAFWQFPKSAPETLARRLARLGLLNHRSTYAVQ